MKVERASVPEIITDRMENMSEERKIIKTRKNGSMTIEAAFGIPLFLFAAVCLIWLIEIQSIRISIINAAQNAAKSAAEDTAVFPVLNTGKLKTDIVSLIGEERIDRSILKGGSGSISCGKSWISPYTGEMNIIVDYQIQIPLSLFGTPTADMEESFKLSAWTGYRGRGAGGNNSDIVYVTDRGSVYHEDYQCSYLQLSIRMVTAADLEELRNESGGRYYACEKCVYGTAMSGAYITETGDRYHNSLGCSGLKRTIHAVPRSEVSGMGGCSRCSN